MAEQVSFSRKSVHFWVYYLSLCMMVVSLPSTRFMITLSLIFLVANWLAEGNLKEKFKTFSVNKPAIAFTLIYVINIVGLMWSENLQYAFSNDLMHKLPTLLLPIVVVTSPKLDLKKIQLLLILFISSVLIVTFAGIAIRAFQNPSDFREASPFVPNIYFSMMLLLAAFQLPTLVREKSENNILFLFALLVSAWLVFFLFYLRSLSGIASLVGVSFYSLIILVYKHKSLLLKVSLTSIFILFLGFTSWLLIHMYKQAHYEVKTDLSSLCYQTEQGNQYTHDTTHYLRENGNLVYIYIADCELEKAWNEKSKLDFYNNDLSNHSVRHTLYRYMSSKGLKKDENGFKMLTHNDIAAVENGTTNYLYTNWPGLYIRVHQMMMGVYIYSKTSYKNPTWSTLTERLDLWRASWESFKKRPLFGWGTGSIINAVDYGLEINESELLGRGMKPHNQYIYILLSLGVFGLLAHIFLYSYIIIKTQAYKIYIFNVFLIIFAINFLANNSFEGQVGQNLIVLFSLFYFFIYPTSYSHLRPRH
jgi:hypothetical protein